MDVPMPCGVKLDRRKTTRGLSLAASHCIAPKPWRFGKLYRTKPPSCTLVFILPLLPLLLGSNQACQLLGYSGAYRQNPTMF